MRCEAVVEHLSNPDSEAASTDLLIELKAHLAACSTCKTEMAAIEQAWQMLEAWKTPEPSATLTQRILLHLPDAESPQHATCEISSTVPFLLDLATAHLDPEIATHLQTCPHCRAEIQTSQCISNLLNEWRDIEPSTTLVSRILSDVRQTDAVAPTPDPTPLRAGTASHAARNRPFSWLTHTPLHLRRLAATVLAASAMLLSFLVVRFDHTPPPHPHTPHILDQYVDSFSTGLHSMTIISRLPDYVATKSTNPLDDFRDPATSLDPDAVVNEILTAPGSDT